MGLWSTILADLKAIITRIESDLANAWNFLTSYIQEAISEEEAALFPAIEAQAAKLLQDEAKTAGMTVKERVAMAVAEITADAIADGKLATVTLYNAYVWVCAHKLGLVDGNQGQSSTSDFSGNTPTT